MLSLTAAFCSALGGVLAVALAGLQMPLHRLAYSQAAFGAALLFLGCCDLLPEAAAGISLARTGLFFSLGAIGSALTARFLRSPAWRRFVSLDSLDQPDPRQTSAAILVDAVSADHFVLLRREVLVVGLVTFVSLSVHNLLEGMSILFAVNDGLESGVRLAAAISLENIPEGLCIALPLLFATRRPAFAVRFALFSGLLEPLGVLLPALFFKKNMTQTSISSTLAIIAGILVFVALAEMIPLAVKTAGSTRMSSLSVWMGCGVLSATMFQPLLMYHGRVGLLA